MSSSDKTPPTPQTAVWYFLGATFVAVAPLLLFRGSPPWVTIVCVVVAVILVAVGGYVFGREVGHRRGRGDDLTPPA